MAKKETREKRSQKARKEDYLITGGNTRKKKLGVKSAPKRTQTGKDRPSDSTDKKPYRKSSAPRGRAESAREEKDGEKGTSRPTRKFSEEKRSQGPRKSAPRSEGTPRPRPARGRRNDDQSTSSDRPIRKSNWGKRDDESRGPRFDGPKKHFTEKRPNRRFNSSEADERRPSNRLDSGKFRANDRKRSAGKFLKDKHFDPSYERKEELTRLNKYLAIAGIASRREADKFIADGLVTVNGEVITEMGYKVRPGDDVKYAGERIKAEPMRYVLLNKPKDVITTMDDEKGRPTVMNLVKKACRERIFPVGRLDRNTTGLLLFTNDGDLAKKLTHPSHDVRKVYHVILDKNVTQADLKKLEAGVELEDGIARADVALYVGDGSVPSEVGLEIHSGKNRIVRRMFEALGYKVVRLDRAVFAGLSKKGLPRGRWRFLTEKEVEYLKML